MLCYVTDLLFIQSKEMNISNADLECPSAIIKFNGAKIKEFQEMICF